MIEKQLDVTRKGALLLERLIERPTFDDYYQLYQLIRQGADVVQMIEEAIVFMGSTISKRSFYILLTSCRDHMESLEMECNKKYDVSALDIQEYIKEKLLESK